MVPQQSFGYLDVKQSNIQSLVRRERDQRCATRGSETEFWLLYVGQPNNQATTATTATTTATATTKKPQQQQHQQQQQQQQQQEAKPGWEGAASVVGRQLILNPNSRNCSACVTVWGASRAVTRVNGACSFTAGRT